MRYLLDRAGFEAVVIEPVGGFFRLLSRRLWNALQFFPGPLMLVAAVFFAPAALLLPFLDSLDRERNFYSGLYMHRIQILTILAALPLAAAEFSGARALADTRAVTAFGPRPPGSPELAQNSGLHPGSIEADRLRGDP